MNKRENDKKLKIYKMLGAEQFQKVVFEVERIKFKVIKKLFPNFIHYFDKFCDYRQKKALKKAKTEEERQKMKKSVKFSKMAMRKEMNTERNRNYHVDKNKPTEIIEYLKWNKKVHTHGLIKDGIAIPILIGLVIAGYPIATILLVAELISAGINFECINIQNYNLCRLKPLEAHLKKREEHITQRNIEQYGEAAEVIGKSVEQSEDLPTFDEIISNIKSPEQLRQMRELIRHKQEERAKEKITEKAKEKVKSKEERK